MVAVIAIWGAGSIVYNTVVRTAMLNCMEKASGNIKWVGRFSLPRPCVSAVLTRRFQLLSGLAGGWMGISQIAVRATRSSR